MTTNLSTPGEPASVFGRALPLIEVTLRREFRMPKVHAREIEQDVYAWFSRFTMRAGTGKSLETWRTNLFWATCQAGRKYWHWRLDGAPVVDERVKRVLSREPLEMAQELAEKLRARESRRKSQEGGS